MFNITYDLASLNIISDVNIDTKDNHNSEEDERFVNKISITGNELGHYSNIENNKF